MLHTRFNGPLQHYFLGKIYSFDLACTHTAACELIGHMEAFPWTYTRKSMFSLDCGTDTN